MDLFDQASQTSQVRRLRGLALIALANYPVQVRRLRLVQHSHNTTFRVDAVDGTHYALRISRPGFHTRDEVTSELRWQLALRRDTALEVPEPIPTRGGDLVLTAQAPGVPEPRLCVLLRWVRGRFLTRSLLPVHLEEVGSFTARLHCHAHTWEAPSGFQRGRVDALTAVGRRGVYATAGDVLEGIDSPLALADWEQSTNLVATLCSPEDTAIVDRVVRNAGAAFQALVTVPDTFGLIHADLHFQNVLFQGRVAGAIDFDLSGFGPYVFDLGVTLVQIQHLATYGALRGALLTGYRRVRALPPEHETYLDACAVLRRLQFVLLALELCENPSFSLRDAWLAGARPALDHIKGLAATVASQMAEV